ncbi:MULTISPECIES: TRAP transporter small permease [unclassified Bradyrhizobium]|uniref:TRAP transporter small permease n=1 Tax=unclassified Bradyrhizobium TaxID=2631580 RepID=UPI0024795DFD|nr:MULTISPECIES: TRAP transporter small permease [unclassified Bradyrhizobium]WGR71038.1 TRAP transporter small permease [Bradyrhizobium sp. ISRA426]WGR75875.1 TRAP transporter small permease [Bradyrhizobium sp. ISRA430]WGR86279.1 TRAP transporter small permease [Bradyrhizobium sp. ISRA432]
MKTIVDVYFRLLRAVIAVLLAVMVVLVFGNVLLRYGFNSGITISEELSRWLFVWMVFLGAIIGLRQRAHLGVDSLVKALPPFGRRICYGLSHALMLYASVLLTEGSWKQTVLNWDTVAPASGLSVGLFYAAGIVFGASSCVIIVHELYRLVTGQIADADLVAVSESEELTHSADAAGGKLQA